MKLQIEAATLGRFAIDTSSGGGASVLQVKHLCTFYTRGNCPNRIENGVGGEEI